MRQTAALSALHSAPPRPAALAGAEPYTFDDSGPMGLTISAYAPIRDESGGNRLFMAGGSPAA